METHNRLTSYPGLIQGFRRALGEMSQAFNGVERGGETMTPVLDLWSLPEWAILRGEQLSHGAAVEAGVAGQSGFGLLWNPFTSGQLIIVTRVYASNQVAADTWDLRYDAVAAAAAGGTLAQSGPNDSRNARFAGVGQLTTGQFRSGTSAAQFGTFAGRFIHAANGSVEIMRPIILLPGAGVHIQASVVNNAVSTVFEWVERPILSTERAERG